MADIVGPTADADPANGLHPRPAMVPAELPQIRLQNVWLNAITERQCVDTVFSEMDQGRGGFIHTVNLDHLRRLVHEPEYAACCRAATIRTADGMPLVWASRLQRTPLPERVSGSSLIWTLSEAAALRGRSVFLLGGDPGVAPRAAQILTQRYPGLRIAGISTPTLERGADEQRRALTQQLVSAKPDLVYVALGSPKQEDLIDALRGSLPSSWWVGVGIAFSFVAEKIQRAPPWMQQVGLEWFHRLLQEPRLTRRYLIQGIPFGLKLLRSSLEVRLGR